MIGDTVQNGEVESSGEEGRRRRPFSLEVLVVRVCVRRRSGSLKRVQIKEAARYYQKGNAISITGNNQATLTQTRTHCYDRGLYTLARLLFPQLTFFLVPRYFPQVMSLTKKYQMARRTLAMADTIVVITYEMCN